ncbi:MAG: OsmC family protein, partial [Flavobacteriales bacterium]|nr:OsmC family protein [Flavobacteriales bacterium]
MKTHQYTTHLNWSDEHSNGTTKYNAYSRNHEIHISGKSTIKASSDSSFRGDPERVNPEELFLSSISSCHMLWFLHLCSIKGITVISYTDEA